MAALVTGITAEDLLTPEWLSDALGLPVAAVELPNLHAPMWGDPKLSELEWLAGGYGQNPEGSMQFLGFLYNGFKERYADRVDDDILELAERMLTKLIEMYDLGDRPHTVQHAD